MPAVPPDHPAEGDAGLPDISHLEFVVPDDLSELDDEVAAYRADQRRAQRSRRLRRIAAAFGWHQHGVSAGAVTGLVVLGALIVASAVGLAPGTARFVRPGPSPLAAPKVTAGFPGGLTPDINVLVSGQILALRTFRPAVFVLLPANCNCAPAVHAVVGSAAASQINVFLVSNDAPGSTAAAQADRLAADRMAGGTYSMVMYDTGLLDKTYRSTGVEGPLAVFVRADGVVMGSAVALASDSHVESQLSQLVSVPDASSTTTPSTGPAGNTPVTRPS